MDIAAPELFNELCTTKLGLWVEMQWTRN